jgi:hypothetical protein
MDLDTAMKQFSYHLVPKKNETLIKMEKEVIDKMENKIETNENNKPKKSLKSKLKAAPMVISIDED